MSLQDQFASEQTEALGDLVATLFCLKPMAEKPYTLAYRTDETGDLRTNAVYEEHYVCIPDARPGTAGLSLNREGVAFIRGHSAVRRARGRR